LLVLGEPGTPWLEGVPAPRAAELAPQLDTLGVFAGLAIARLELLAELKREVGRRAQEIAEISTRRLHAEFVRGVAHELRKPTEEVRYRVEELCASRTQWPSPTLDRIRAASREMSRRLDLLLFHSGVRPDLQRIDVIRVVDDAVEGMRAACRDRDYQVHHELARMPMVGDPSRLLSVVENLLDNAVKATTRGQTILVRTTLDPGDPGQRPWVRLEVEDGGRGIPPERLEEIFEPGVALAPSGFGLGLSLAREIVRMHGGTISVESRPGRTVFQVKLPQFRSGSEEDDDGIDLAGIEQDEQE
jgi:two-component system OmpR family sensor kinase